MFPKKPDWFELTTVTSKRCCKCRAHDKPAIPPPIIATEDFLPLLLSSPLAWPLKAMLFNVIVDRLLIVSVTCALVAVGEKEITVLSRLGSITPRNIIKGLARVFMLYTGRQGQQCILLWCVLIQANPTRGRLSKNANLWGKEISLTRLILNASNGSGIFFSKKCNSAEALFRHKKNDWMASIWWRKKYNALASNHHWGFQRIGSNRRS